MEKMKKAFAVVFIIVLVAILMAVLDNSLDLSSETAQAWADRNIERNLDILQRNAEKEDTEETAEQPTKSTYRENEYMHLQFEDFTVGNSFQYTEQKWNKSYVSVMENWGYAFKQDVRESTISNLVCYRSEGTRILDDLRGDTLFYYYHGSDISDFYNTSKLKAISFRFSMETVEDYETWYNTQYEKLVQLYGAEDETVEATYEHDELTYTVTGVQWNAGETAMQLLLRTGGDEAPAVIIKLMTE